MPLLLSAATGVVLALAAVPAAVPTPVTTTVVLALATGVVLAWAPWWVGGGWTVKSLLVDLPKGWRLEP